ncbi:MAG: hypothetical protein F2663_09545 [Actinobacteria bacterium]|uniref:Unannotated protein n=1 Tax=freshwater metagenome TaxID=449393 RepID=A0A6J6QDQ1_9ZZZZ|nr:hypothetical protein [Actinomycetota bacterium]
MLRVFANATVTNAPYGGANSFLRALYAALRERGVRLTHDVNEHVDVALLNALTDGLTAATAQTLNARGIPVVHRRVGYAVSGSPEMRAVHDGVVEGDRQQLAFDPYVRRVIFQSAYSAEVFRSSGFTGNATIIHNGTDSRIFGLYDRRLPLRRPRRRAFWDGNETFHFAITSWSKDERKGFAYFRQFDEELRELPNVSVTYMGRVPDGLSFDRIAVHAPRPARDLGRFLRQCHGFLAFSEKETCSNALLEGINSGLQVIYLDSGANAELAENYGVRFEGSLTDAVSALLSGYEERRARSREHPFDIGPVAERYLEVFRHAIEEGPVA